MSGTGVRFDRPVRNGFSMVPHRLWSADISPMAVRLIGWLHSHDSSYFARVTRNSMVRDLRSSRGAIDRALGELQDIGAVELSAGDHTQVTLLAAWWEGLSEPVRNGPPSERPDGIGSAGGQNPSGGGRNPSGRGTESVRVVNQVEDQREHQPIRANFVGAPESPMALVPASMLSNVNQPMPKEQKHRERDPLFDALVAACGLDYEEMTARARRACAVAVAELRKVGATPEEVCLRVSRYPSTWTLTPNAIASRWAELGRARPVAGRQAPRRSAGFAAVLELASREGMFASAGDGG